MQDDLLRILKDYVEGRLSHSGWHEWWAAHAAEVEARWDRATFLRLKRRGFGGAISVLKQHGVVCQPVPGYCQRCGEPLFTAMPGVTTVREIRAFAEASAKVNRFRGWEVIVRDGWIHPGQYCPHGCTVILSNIKRSDNGESP